ncbi:MAG: LysR family transcriptional regulator [Pseudomonadota bacterium]
MEPLVTLKQLAAFLVTAEAGSIGRAATLSGSSKPAISSQITALESATGLTLFERRSNGMLLTPDGRRVAELARSTLDTASEIGTLKNHKGGKIDATIAIGVSTSVGPYLLPAATYDLHKNHPTLRLAVREGSTRTLTRDLLAGLHDIILTQLPLRDETIRHGVILREELFVLMACDHPLAERSSLQVSDLTGQRILTLGPDFALTTQVERLSRDAQASALHLYEGNSMDALRIMCAMSTDVAIVPEFYVRSEVVGDAAVTVRRLQGRPLNRTIVLAWRQSQGDPGYVEPLLQTILETAQRVREKKNPLLDTCTSAGEQEA